MLPAIRQATLADKPAIFDFLKIAYQGRSEFKFPDRWGWAYAQNPFWMKDGLPIWIAVGENGQVIGQSAALIEPLIIGGNEHRVGWGVDFYVLPDFRGQGFGSRLQAANNAGNEVFMSLSMAESAARIKTGLGMVPAPVVPVYTKIIHHEPKSVKATLQNRIPGIPLPGMPRLIARALTARENARDFQLLDKLDLSIAIETIEQFDSEFDTFWLKTAPHFSALVKRDAKYLNWKFVRQPHMNHIRFAAYRENVLVGYLVIRRARPPERNAGIICDLFTDPDDLQTARTLLLHAVQFFRREKVTYITGATSVPAYQGLFTALGFKETKRVTPLIRGPVHLPAEGWLLGKGDHDWDQYPLE